MNKECKLRITFTFYRENHNNNGPLSIVNIKPGLIWWTFIWKKKYCGINAILDIFYVRISLWRITKTPPQSAPSHQQGNLSTKIHFTKRYFFLNEITTIWMKITIWMIHPLGWIQPHQIIYNALKTYHCLKISSENWKYKTSNIEINNAR